MVKPTIPSHYTGAVTTSIIHNIPVDKMTVATEQIYRALESTAGLLPSAMIYSKKRYYEFIEDTTMFYDKITRTVKRRLESLEKLKSAFELFKKRLELLGKQQITLVHNLEMSEQDIKNMIKLIEESNKKFAHIVLLLLSW